MATFTIESSFNETLGQTIDEKGWVTTRLQRTLTVVSSEPSTVAEVRITAPIPRVNDPHPESFSSRCVAVDVNRETPIWFTAVCQYESPKRPADSDEETPPYELPVDIEWSGESSEEQIDEDANGNAIVIPGTRERIEGLTRPVDDLVGTFTKNYLLFDPVAILAYKNTVNSDTFLGFAPGLGRIKDIRAINQIKDDVPYWKVTVVIAFRVPYRTTDAKAWYKRVLCQGFYEVQDGEVVRATDDNQLPVTSPVLLTSTGERLTGGTPTWLEFQIFKTSSFNSLGLF